MNNRLKNLFDEKSHNILNVYFTAGHPQLDSTVDIIQHLANNNVDIVEIGMPYSDPLADGPTIQASSQIALKNGMNLNILFDQVSQARKLTNIPFIMMGYLNQIIQYGVEKFLKTAKDSGVDGLIIPDLPMDIYEKQYKSLFQKHNLTISFLITPQTSDERILEADRLSTGFVYVVAQSSITGNNGKINEEQQTYFEKIKSMTLNSPKLIGFGIHDKTTFENACKYAEGAIIGSAFIRAIDQSPNLEKVINKFVKSIKN